MASGGDVLTFLCPNAGWTIYGNEYENIVWKDNIPLLTKEQFEAGFEQVEIAKIQAETDKAAKKAAAEAKLAALGLTTDDLKALGLN